MADIKEVLDGQKKLTDKYYHVFDELMDAAEGESLTGLNLKSRFRTREGVIRDCLTEFIEEHYRYTDLVQRHEVWFQDHPMYENPSDLAEHFETRRTTLADTTQVKDCAERVVATKSVRDFDTVIKELYDTVKSVGKIDRWA